VRILHPALSALDIHILVYLGPATTHFLYTTYHTPSNTKSSELHFCVRNNSGNSGIHMDLISDVCCRLPLLPPLLLLLQSAVFAPATAIAVVLPLVVLFFCCGCGS